MLLRSLVAAAAVAILAACGHAAQHPNAATQSFTYPVIWQPALPSVDIELDAGGKWGGDLTILEGGNQQLDRGIAAHPAPEREMRRNAAQIQAAIGATERFAGVPGNASRVLNGYGPYARSFRLMP